VKLSYNKVDCSQPSVCRIFIRSLNARIESRENWKSAQNGRLDRVGGGASTHEHFHQAFSALTNARCHKIAVCNIFYWPIARSVRCLLSYRDKRKKNKHV